MSVHKVAICQFASLVTQKSLKRYLMDSFFNCEFASVVTQKSFKRYLMDSFFQIPEKPVWSKTEDLLLSTSLSSLLSTFTIHFTIHYPEVSTIHFWYPLSTIHFHYPLSLSIFLCPKPSFKNGHQSGYFFLDVDFRDSACDATRRAILSICMFRGPLNK